MTSLLGALGAVCLLFGLLSLLLAMLGAPTDLRWIWFNFGVGVVFLGIAAVGSFDRIRERVSSGEGRRVGKYGTSAILSAAFSIAILGSLAFLSVRYPVRFDWTEQKVHSLSDQSRKVLGGLDRDVEVVAFFSRIDTPQVRELLDRYGYESDRFRVEYVDPNERPGLLDRYGVTPEDLGQGLVHIDLGGESVNIAEVTEENITNAMVKLSRTQQKKVYFLEGHNERPIEGDGSAEKDGFARAADALRNENYQVNKLLLASMGEVPDDADVVIVAGATRPLLSQERGALERYLGQGGALMVLVDPRAKTDLVEDVRGWGVQVGDDVVVDRALALFGRATTPFAGGYDPAHEITRDLRETTLFHVARSVAASDEANGDFTEIVFTGDGSWAERDLDRFYTEGAAEMGDDDRPGPVPIAVAGTPRLSGANGEGEAEAAESGGEEAESRLVVFGDSDFASNEMIEAYRNRDLFVNSVNWLLGDVEAISVRPNRSRASRFALSTEQFQTIRTLSLFVLPQAIALLGVIVWWSRRRSHGA